MDNRLLSRMKANISQLIVLAALMALVVFFSLNNEHFFGVPNFLSIGMTLSVIGLICVGQTLCLLTGGFDLSVGMIASFSAILCAFLVERMGVPYLSALVIVVAFGIAAGTLNGVMIAKFKINALITTLGFSVIYRGFVFIVSGGYSINVADPVFGFIGQTRVFGIPIPILILLFVFALFFFVLRYTRFGRSIYGTGGNKEAARISGINTDGVVIKVYLLSGLLACIAGIILSSRLGAAQTTAGGAYSLDSVAACVLGGVALAGGKGNVLGAFMGAAIIAILQSGLIMLRMPIYYQDVATGIVLIGAVLLQTFQFDSKKKIA